MDQGCFLNPTHSNAKSPGENIVSTVGVQYRHILCKKISPRLQFNQLLLLWMVTLALLLSAMPTLAAASPQSAEISLADDRIAGGERVTVAQPVQGDLISAGGDIEINAAVAGDLLAFGGRVQLSASASQDAYIAAGQVTISDNILRNARIAGGEVRIETGSRIAGNASIAGGDLHLGGDIGGYLLVAGGSVFIDGVIDGDVRIAAETIEFGPNARIQGNLLYASENELLQDNAAIIVGNTNRLPWAQDKYEDERNFAAGFWIWTFGLAVVALVLLALTPGFSQSVSGTFRHQAGWSLLLGLAVLLCTPAVIVLLAITMLGIPLALLLLCAYPVILLLGYVLAAIAGADIALQRFKPEHVANNSSRMIAATLALICLSLIAMIPFLGALLVFLILLTGLGALCLAMQKQRHVD